MKKNITVVIGITVLTLMMVILLLVNNIVNKGTSASVTTSESNNLTKDNPMGEGVENIHLQFFLQKSANDVYPPIADNDYKDVINYVDENGVITNKTFMDTFLFIPSGAYFSSGNFIETLQESHIDTYLASEVAEMKRTNSFIDTEINSKYGTRQKLNVIMTIALPQNSGCKSSRDSAKACLTRFIDKSIAAFNNANLSNLRLVGFYWDEERIKPTIANENNATDFNEIVHQKGYKTVWIPYIDHYKGYNNNNYTPQVKSGSPSYLEGSYTRAYTYGFDFASLQTNYYFEGNNSGWMNNFNNVGRLTVAASAANYYKLGIELELNSNSTWSWYGSRRRDTYCQRFKGWLNQAATEGYNWDKTVKTYYIFQTFANDYNQVDACFGPTRYIYDAVYYYSQQRLSDEFINTVNSYLKCDTSAYPVVSNNDNGEAFPASVNKILLDSNGGLDNVQVYVRCGDNKVYSNAAATSVISIPKPTKDGYTFLGWYTNSNGGTKVLNADGSIAASVAGYTKGNNWHTYYNRTLYAKWGSSDEPSPDDDDECEVTIGGSGKTVKFNSNGGSAVSNISICSTCTPEDIVLPTPTRDGYTFLGWYADNKFTTKVSGGHNTVENAIWNEIDCNHSETTLYAKWEANDDDGGNDNVIPPSSSSSRPSSNSNNYVPSDNSGSSSQQGNVDDLIDENPRTGISSRVSILLALTVLSIIIGNYYFKRKVQ